MWSLIGQTFTLEFPARLFIRLVYNRNELRGKIIDPHFRTFWRRIGAGLLQVLCTGRLWAFRPGGFSFSAGLAENKDAYGKNQDGNAEPEESFLHKLVLWMDESKTPNVTVLWNRGWMKRRTEEQMNGEFQCKSLSDQASLSCIYCPPVPLFNPYLYLPNTSRWIRNSPSA